MNLTPDAKYLVAQNLSGKDLIQLCATNSEMRKLCHSEKFNPIWKKNIKNDFGFDYKGKNGYMEYLHNTYVFKQKFWIVTMYDTNSDEIIQADIYRSYDDAISGIANDILKSISYGHRPTYPIIKTQIKTTGYIKHEATRYAITQGEFKNTAIDNEKIYQAQLNELADLIYGKENNEQLKDDFKDDFATMLEDISDEEEFSFEGFWGSFVDRLSDSSDVVGDLSEIKRYVGKMLGVSQAEIEDDE